MKKRIIWLIKSPTDDWKVFRETDKEDTYMTSLYDKHVKNIQGSLYLKHYQFKRMEAYSYD